MGLPVRDSTRRVGRGTGGGHGALRPLLLPPTPSGPSPARAGPAGCRSRGPAPLVAIPCSRNAPTAGRRRHATAIGAMRTLAHPTGKVREVRERDADGRHGTHAATTETVNAMPAAPAAMVMRAPRRSLSIRVASMAMRSSMGRARLEWPGPPSARHPHLHASQCCTGAAMCCTSMQHAAAGLTARPIRRFRGRSDRLEQPHPGAAKPPYVAGLLSRISSIRAMWASVSRQATSTARRFSSGWLVRGAQQHGADVGVLHAPRGAENRHAASQTSASRQRTHLVDDLPSPGAAGAPVAATHSRTGSGGCPRDGVVVLAREDAA